MPHVLIVDDERDLVRLLEINLQAAGLETTSAGDGQGALRLASERTPDLVLLDLMLPDLSGTEVCRQLRADPARGDVAILMLTARGDEYDRVLGFEVGADDYVVKPFSVRELMMRVKALSKRAHERRAARASAEGVAPKQLKWRGLEVDVVRHRVFSDGVEVALRPLEYKLLSLFLEHPGKVFSRAELLEEVWGITADVNTRTVDTHVRRLRERLATYGDAVETVHGFGYRLREV